MNSSTPLAYKIGWIPFIHTEIYLDSRPLIPRTETEYWVNEVIQIIHKSQILHHKSIKILDLCAGSGCIGVAVLKEIPEASVDFVEIDSAHHDTIRKNIIENKLDASRTRIFGGDLFENVSSTYDFILANPPYIDPDLIERVQNSVLKHEPEKALLGGKNGLEIIERILSEFPKYLRKNGVLYLEHEPEQVSELSKHPLYKGSYPDQFGTLRFSKFSN